MQCIWRRCTLRSCVDSSLATGAFRPSPEFAHALPIRSYSTSLRSKKPQPENAIRKVNASAAHGKDKLPKAARVKAPKKSSDQEKDDPKPREPWMLQKAALKSKFGDEQWMSRKRLSPDAIDGIRTMHASDPERFSTPVLAQNFEVSPEVIRRILRSKWQASPEEQEDRRQRWERRGEKIWAEKAEVGVKPPKPWRMRGVGRVTPGDVPTWKTRRGGRSDTGRSDGQDKVMSSSAAFNIQRELVASRPTLSAELDFTSPHDSRENISGRIL